MRGPIACLCFHHTRPPRLVAERILDDCKDRTFLQGEVSAQCVKLSAPRSKYRYHLFVSKANSGAHELLRGLQFYQEQTASALRVTTEVEQMCNCEHMFLYLGANTWIPT